MAVRVQTEDFDIGRELSILTEGRKDIGGLCCFTGLVRDMNDGKGIDAMTLEHYPGMTEAMLLEIDAEAQTRWSLDASLIIHRVGRLVPGDRIVLVAAASPHRQAAFEACHFLMDWLKIKAPFWKSEALADGTERWVNHRTSDTDAATRWMQGD
jgi:molybdopterin synthase catalytic subunit